MSSAWSSLVNERSQSQPTTTTTMSYTASPVPEIKPIPSGSSSASSGKKRATPDEPFEIDPGMPGRKAWVVKIPKFLLERWETVNEAGVPLGSLRVHTDTETPTITLHLPEAGPSQYQTSDLPSEYTLHLINSAVTNEYVFGERKRDWENEKEKPPAEPTLYAAVNHEGSLQPVMDDRYRKITKARLEKAEQPKRSIVRLENAGMDQGKLNQLNSGIGNVKARLSMNKFQSRIRKNKNLLGSGAGERAVRMEINQLRDLIFDCFTEYRYWSFQALKARTAQPDAHLRDVLKEVAILETTGDYSHKYIIKPQYMTNEMRVRYGLAVPVKQDEEEDDMVEVS